MKDAILDNAEKMVQKGGLSGVSFQQLADTVNLSKASIFHHFPSRDDLVHALIERCSTKYGSKYLAIISKKISAPAKIQALAECFEKEISEGRTCLLGSLGSNYDSLSEPLRADLEETARTSIRLFAQVFEQGRAEESLKYEGKPLTAASAFLAMLQGAQQLARYCNDPSMFSTSVESFVKSLSN